MARTLFTFLFGLVTGVAIVLLLQGPIDIGKLRGSADVAYDAAGRSARNLTLQASVRAALALQRDFALIGGGITVAAEDGNVTLSGAVASEDQRVLAGLIARGVDGVESVDNQLQIELPQ